MLVRCPNRNCKSSGSGSSSRGRCPFRHYRAGVLGIGSNLEHVTGEVAPVVDLQPGIAARGQRADVVLHVTVGAVGAVAAIVHISGVVGAVVGLAVTLEIVVLGEQYLAVLQIQPGTGGAAGPEAGLMVVHHEAGDLVIPVAAVAVGVDLIQIVNAGIGAELHGIAAKILLLVDNKPGIGACFQGADVTDGRTALGLGARVGGQRVAVFLALVKSNEGRRRHGALLHKRRIDRLGPDGSSAGSFLIGKARDPAPSMVPGVSEQGTVLQALHAGAGGHPPPSVPSEPSCRYQYGCPL